MLVPLCTGSIVSAACANSRSHGHLLLGVSSPAVSADGCGTSTAPPVDLGWVPLSCSPSPSAKARTRYEAIRELIYGTQVSMPIVLFVKHTTDSFKSRPWQATSWLALPMAPPDWWLAPGANSANVFEHRLSLNVRVVPYGHVHVLTQTCTQDLGRVHNYVLVSDCASHVTRCAIQHYESRDGRLLVCLRVQ